MKTLHTLALLFSVWHVGQVQNRTANRGETTPPAVPVVTVLMPPFNCFYCKLEHRDTKGHTEYDFRFVSVGKKPPKWIQDILDKNKDLPPEKWQGYPFTVWHGKDGKTRYYTSGWEDFKTWEAAYKRTNP